MDHFKNRPFHGFCHTWLRIRPHFPLVFSIKVKMGKFQLFSWLIHGSKSSINNGSGARVGLSCGAWWKCVSACEWCGVLIAAPAWVLLPREVLAGGGWRSGQRLFLLPCPPLYVLHHCCHCGWLRGCCRNLTTRPHGPPLFKWKQRDVSVHLLHLSAEARCIWTNLCTWAR